MPKLLTIALKMKALKTFMSVSPGHGLMMYLKNAQIKVAEIQAVIDKHACKKGKSKAQIVVESTIDQTVITGAWVCEILNDLLSHLPGP